jgi:hypothetical protein
MPRLFPPYLLISIRNELDVDSPAELYIVNTLLACCLEE